MFALIFTFLVMFLFFLPEMLDKFVSKHLKRFLKSNLFAGFLLCMVPVVSAVGAYILIL